MADYTLTVTGRAITLPQGFPSQISNTEGADRVKFNCDSEYSGYALVAVFKNGERGKAYPVAIPADRSYVSIPSAPLKRRGWLYIGLFGVDGLKVLPTLWASPVEIKEGTDTGGIYEEESASLIPGLIERVADVEADVDELETAVDGLEDDVTEIDLRVGALEDDVDELEEAVEGKQDTITDLDTIRSGAAAGATALQSVPIASADNIGGAKFQDYWGIGIFSDGRTYVAPATGNQITFRNNNNRPITPFNMDTAFRTCITDPAQELTDNQKEEACATIGAVSHFDGFRKIIDYTTTDSETTSIMFTHDDEGEPISLQYEDIIIKTYFPHGTANTDVRVFTRETDTSWNPKNMLLYYSSGYMVHGTDTRYTMAYIKNVWRGAWTTLKQTYSSSDTQYAASACNPSNAFCEIDGEKIVRFRFGIAAAAGAFPAGGKIEIYVK